MQVNKKKVLFFRDYINFTGGHLKYWHYIGHTGAFSQFHPQLYLSDRSIVDKNIAWKSVAEIQKVWHPVDADVLFVAGIDWNHIPFDVPSSIPVINLVQHVRHGNANDIRYKFLSRPAIRICVSHEVSLALKKSGQVNGPVITIPAAIDVGYFDGMNSINRHRVFIDGIKNKSLALNLFDKLNKLSLDCKVSVNKICREDYIRELSSCSVFVCLPNFTEGFYLPALEGMMCGAVVVCPDCLGNREYCVDGVNCFQPAFAVDDLVDSVRRAVTLTEDKRHAMLNAGFLTAERHGLPAERLAYKTKVLDCLDALWSQVSI